MTIVRRNEDVIVVPQRSVAANLKIAVVIPCYRVTRSIEQVIQGIGSEVAMIVCVDDACPDNSGSFIAARFATDPRVSVVSNEKNLGVGGAVCHGYHVAIDARADIIVKLDGDGQMEPGLIPNLVAPIAAGDADYVKGNRFFSIETILPMSFVRIVGNAGLSFITKLSSGYWDLFDPTNGFTAIEARVAALLPLDKLHRRFFFESDMLFRLSIVRARILEMPMMSKYADEKSNLSEMRTLLTFPALHARNLWKRICYNYFLRGFSIASLNLVMGLVLFCFGITFGLFQWAQSIAQDQVSTAGTVMLAALPTLLGLQLMLAFLAYDIAMVPTRAIHPDINPSFGPAGLPPPQNPNSQRRSTI
jgi:dolichol-phosphate mannosyltransferase